MSVFACNTSQEVNGVSWLHGKVSQEMFSSIWKGYFPEEDILKNIKRIDRERRDYYRYYTGKSWENLENYDLMINTTKLSYDEMVECVIDYLKMRGLIAK